MRDLAWWRSDEAKDARAKLYLAELLFRNPDNRREEYKTGRIPEWLWRVTLISAMRSCLPEPIHPLRLQWLRNSCRRKIYLRPGQNCSFMTLCMRWAITRCFKKTGHCPGLGSI